MTFRSGYINSLSHFDLERYKEKIKVCGFDPYELTAADCSEDPKLWPVITDVDRMDYFVYKTNFTSKQSMKALKTLEAHNFFTSGLVSRPRTKELSSDSVILLGKVRHSQSMSLDALKCWLLVKKDGEIVTGHCTCMAGRGEACSHLAATVFLVEYAGKVRDSVAGTDVLNAWLPPTMSAQVPKKRISDMDFTSPAGRLVKISKSMQNEPEGSTSVPGYITNCTPASNDAVKNLFAAVAGANPKAIVLSTVEAHRNPFIPPPISDDLPKLLNQLYDEEASTLLFNELLIRCQAIIKDVSGCSEEQVQKVEKLTRSQAPSDLWYKFRIGRITASNMKMVCQGNITKPARSTINTICYGSQKFYSADIERGRRLEKAARQKYTFLQKSEHEDFSVKECGLFLHGDQAYVGASLDGIVSCTCCEGTGGLEIKCPREENLNSCFDKNGNLLRNHQYFYQVQTQMYVCELNYCDFFVYSAKKHLLQRVLPDKASHNEIIEKSQLYFMFVILPELIAKHFSVNRPPLAPCNTNTNTGETNVICFCQQPRRDPVVVCAGQNCTFAEFHCRCVDLAVPKKNWKCTQCKKGKK